MPGAGRLPERFFAVIARTVGWRLDERVDPKWLWKGRRVHMFDGSTVAMPDTPENRAEYPLTYNQAPGTCFPIARIGAIISLSCGAILDLGICRYAGKGQGEVSLLRQIWDVLRPGDVLLGDRLMGNWASIYWLQQRGVDTVSRLGAQRTADFRKGIRLGEDDHVVVWKKPTSIRSVDRPTYNALPDSIVVREVRFRVEQRGFRTRVIVVVTTILDPEQASKEELASLYRARWNNELDLRNIKITLQMDMLRCKTPETGAEGDLDPRPGLQPDPHSDGPGGGRRRGGTAVDQLQGDTPAPGGVPPLDRLPGGSRPGSPGGALPAVAPGDRRAARRRPPRPFRAAADQAEAQGIPPPEQATAGAQRADG